MPAAVIILGMLAVGRVSILISKALRRKSSPVASRASENKVLKSMRTEGVRYPSIIEWRTRKMAPNARAMPPIHTDHLAPTCFSNEPLVLVLIWDSGVLRG